MEKKEKLQKNIDMIVMLAKEVSSDDGLNEGRTLTWMQDVVTSNRQVEQKVVDLTSEVVELKRDNVKLLDHIDIMLAKVDSSVLDRKALETQNDLLKQRIQLCKEGYDTRRQQMWQMKHILQQMQTIFAINVMFDSDSDDDFGEGTSTKKTKPG